VAGGRWLVLVVFVGGALVLAGCGGNAEARGLQVVATTTQIEDMTRQIAGDRAEVAGLLPANADAHDFEPTPQDVARVAGADLVLEHGMHLDVWADDLVDQSATDATIVVVTTGIPTIHSSDDEHDDMDDPHVWFDVANARIMTENIRDALIAVDPDGRAAYEANAAAYLSDLDELDAWIRQQVEMIPAGERKLVTNHDALGYFVRAYGFEYVGSVVPSMDSQSQPSARETAALIDTIKAEGVQAIFTEAALNPDLAGQVAAEAGVEIVNGLYGDSLGPVGSDAATYIGMMRANTTTIVEALR
jgi:ABC-type Zn uptake system ZnuABC Zn-binding protein ZnuA